MSKSRGLVHRSYRNPGNTPNNPRKPNYKPQRTGKGDKVGILELARRTGLSGAHISKIFGGKRSPSLDTAAVIATTLGISIDVLYVRLLKAQETEKEESARKTRIAEARRRDEARI